MFQNLLRFNFAVLAVLILDQVTKHWAEQQSWVVQINQGISFGMFAELSASALLILGALVLLGISYWTFVVHKQDFTLLGVFVGGGVSNLVDRVVLGGVRDWLPFAPLGVRNNLADWAISLAVFLLFALEIRRWQRQRNQTS